MIISLATSIQFSSVQSLSHVQFFVTPWIAACQASLSIINSHSSLKLMSIESNEMPFSHLILCHPLLLLPPIPPIIRVFSSESTLRVRWPKYWRTTSASLQFGHIWCVCHIYCWKQSSRTNSTHLPSLWISLNIFLTSLSFFHILLSTHNHSRKKQINTETNFIMKF